MNKENLPKIVKENIFTKVKKWFLMVFKKKDKCQKINGIKNEEKDYIRYENFKQNIKLECKNKLGNLQEQIKNKDISVSDLTDEELDEMILLYTKQIEEKKIKLREYRKIISNQRKRIPS